MIVQASFRNMMNLNVFTVRTLTTLPLCRISLRFWAIFLFWQDFLAGASVKHIRRHFVSSDLKMSWSCIEVCHLLYWFYLFIFAFLLINFMSLISFYIPYKHQKSRDFLFSGGLEIDMWHEMRKRSISSSNS